ncbi:hypothetical protein EMIT07CA2_550104 [Brevibacillus sp. IT-7CA2]|uniref:hypothetical protein n=1 Tax=Brevibacillus sp. IT-7CA2 TaxID=3026436 RepID=UPI0039E12E17
MRNRFEEIVDWDTEDNWDDIEDMMDENDEWDDEEEFDQEKEEIAQNEMKSYGRKLTQEERIQRFFDKYENMEPVSLMDGLHLYHRVTHERVHELVPSLEKDCKIFEKLIGTEVDERLNRALLRLFANAFYQKAHKEYKKTWYYAPIPFGFNGLDRVVVLLERFRRFTLTAKQFVTHQTLKTGDILLDGSIIVVQHGQPFRLRQGGAYSEGKFHFEKVRSHHATFVIGYSNKLNVEKLQMKWVQRTHADSMDGWMNALKRFSQQFPSDSYDSKGFTTYGQVESKYVDWYFANPEKVIEYYRKREGKKRILLSDLPTWLKKQVINKMQENPRSMKRDVKIVWKGKAYCIPSLMNYIESPIRELLETTDDMRIYQINFALDSWYEWDKRTDICVLGGQTVPTLQIELFEEEAVTPTGSEQMSLF